jgi:hypothetical protein
MAEDKQGDTTPKGLRFLEHHRVERARRGEETAWHVYR